MSIKKIIISKILILLSLTSIGQTLGLLTSPCLTLAIYNEKENNFGISNGVFYEHEILNQIIISTGIDYAIQNITLYGFAHTMEVSLDEYPEKMQYNFHFIELPIRVAFTPSSNPQAKWRFYFTAGYSLGYSIRVRETYIYFDKHESIQYSKWDLNYKDNLTIGKFGFEIRHKMNDKFNIAFGSFLKHYYFFKNGIDERFDNFNIFIKVGINLKSNKENKNKSESIPENK